MHIGFKENVMIKVVATKISWWREITVGCRRPKLCLQPPCAVTHLRRPMPPPRRRLLRLGGPAATSLPKQSGCQRGGGLLLLTNFLLWGSVAVGFPAAPWSWKGEQQTLLVGSERDGLVSVAVLIRIRCWWWNPCLSLVPKRNRRPVGTAVFLLLLPFLLLPLRSDNQQRACCSSSTSTDRLPPSLSLVLRSTLMMKAWKWRTTH